MCGACDERLIGRRTFVSALGLGLVVSAVLRPFGTALAAEADGPKTSITADQALARLKAGNEKFVTAPELCSAELAKRRADVVSSQAPWATIVSCADSRVPPELLFGGLGLGDLFVARNAGNMVDTATMGTIEYGAAVLGVPLIVVLGHESCGAVEAACDVVTKKATFPGSIGPMVRAIVPAAIAVRGKPGDFTDNAVRESAKRTAAQISGKSKIVGDLIKAGKVKVVAARYGFANGNVEYLA
jgi:carbonic anhydrase